MILVDDRIGSADLIGHLRHWQVPCQMERLEYGDACIAGNGPDGPGTVAVGVEIKRMHDTINCMEDGRFAGKQLPGLVSTYDRIWLVVEGWYRPDFSTGILLGPGERRREVAHGSRRYMYRDLDNWLTTMEVKAGIRVRRVGDRVETARFMADLYGWWQKDWNDHHAHLAIHEQRPDTALFRRASVTRMVAAQLPGIGFKKSALVEQHFGTIQRMIDASVDEWEEIEGVGETMARRIYAAIRGR